MTSNQEFWLSVMGLVAAFIVAFWLIYWLYRVRALTHEERRLMIERGMTPPPPQPTGWPAVRAREQELRYEERRLLIEKGLQPGAESVTNFLSELLPKTDEKQPKQPEHYLYRGLARLAFGLGLAGAYAVFRSSGIDASSDTENWFLFFGVISPVIALWGAANVVYYQVTRNTGSGAPISERDPGR